MSAGAKTVALAFADVTVRYDGAGPAALSNVTLRIAANERVALVGLNGSGKTTLLMAAVGLCPHEGSIEICGTILSARTLGVVRRNVGFLFNIPEDQLLMPTALDDVAFGPVRRGRSPVEARRRALELLRAFGVGALASVPVGELSHGQKQRVALAGALVTEPELLLLDEPSSGLDPPARRELVQLLTRSSAAMLVATHDLALASRLCTRAVLLERGRVVDPHADLGALRRQWGWEPQGSTPERG